MYYMKVNFAKKMEEKYKKEDQEKLNEIKEKLTIALNIDTAE